MISPVSVARAVAGEDGSGSGAPIVSIPPDGLIIITTPDMVLLPGTVIPITISQQHAIAAAQQAVREERQIGLLMQREAGAAEPSAIDLHRVGTVANVLRY